MCIACAAPSRRGSTQALRGAGVARRMLATAVMTAPVVRPLVWVIASLVLAVLGGVSRAEPKPGAATVLALHDKLGDAVDHGDSATILACFDTSKPNGRTYPDYLIAVGVLHVGQNAVRARAAAFDPAMTAKVEPLLVRMWGFATYPYGPQLEHQPYFREGSIINPPGSPKAEMVVVKKRGVFLYDASAVFHDGDDEINIEKAKYLNLGGEWSRAARMATSADDLLARLTKLANP
jgi:hypothetical protein